MIERRPKSTFIRTLPTGQRVVNLSVKRGVLVYRTNNNVIGIIHKKEIDDKETATSGNQR